MPSDCIFILKGYHALKCDPSVVISVDSLQGRIIADALVYQRDTAANETEIIIESDPFAVTSLIKLLSLYKLRSKVSVSLAKYQVSGRA